MHNRGTIIEGIGDEALYSMTVFLIISVCFVVAIFKWLSRHGTSTQTIHAESAQEVEQARQRLRQQNSAAPEEPVTPTAPPRDEADLQCPICLARAQFAVETNCGHIFCGNCFTTYWRSGWLGSVKCPVCRQSVNILLFSFNDEEQTVQTETRSEVMNDVHQYNRRFSGEPRTFMEVVRDLPTLLRHFFADFFSVSGLIMMFRFRVVLLFVIFLIYFLSPLDIIPEAAFGILGFIDDLFIFMLFLIHITMMYRQVVAERT